MLKFCLQCKKPLNEDHMFCPYCGQKWVLHEEFLSILDTSFNRMADKRKTNYSERIDLIAEKLENLEKDLCLLLEETNP